MAGLAGESGKLVCLEASRAKIIRFVFALHVRTGFALLMPGVSVKVPKFFRFNLLPLRRI